jgi:hypothetical protein
VDVCGGCWTKCLLKIGGGYDGSATFDV